MTVESSSAGMHVVTESEEDAIRTITSAAYCAIMTIQMAHETKEQLSAVCILHYSHDDPNST